MEVANRRDLDEDERLYWNVI